MPEGVSVPNSHLRFGGGYSIKKQLLVRLVVALGIPLRMTLVPVCKLGNRGSRIHHERCRYEQTPPRWFAGCLSSGWANRLSIQSTVDAFRAALGVPNNGNSVGPLTSGRREINWDGGGVNTTTPPVTPFDRLPEHPRRRSSPRRERPFAGDSIGRTRKAALQSFSIIPLTPPSLAPSARCGCSLQRVATSLKLCFFYPAATGLSEQR